MSLPYPQRSQHAYTFEKDPCSPHGSSVGWEHLPVRARSFDTRAVDTGVIRAVHDTLQRELESDRPAFPIRASDHLEVILSDPDDLDLNLVPKVARLSGRSLDDAARNPHYERVRSVADLVMFFNEQARAHGPDSERSLSR